MAFLPADGELCARSAEAVEKICVDEGLVVLGWRDVPTDSSMIGATALSVMPTFRQLFVADEAGERTGHRP